MSELFIRAINEKNEKETAYNIADPANEDICYFEYLAAKARVDAIIAEERNLQKQGIVMENHLEIPERKNWLTRAILAVVLVAALVAVIVAG